MANVVGRILQGGRLARARFVIAVVGLEVVSKTCPSTCMCKGPPGFSAGVMKVLSATEDAAIRLTDDSGSSAASLCSLVPLPYYAGPLESSEESDRQVQMVNPRVLHISQRRQSKSAIEDIKACRIAKAVKANRTSTGNRKRKRCPDVVARALQQLPAGISDRDQSRRLGIPFTSFRDVKARIAATTNEAVQSSTEAVFSSTDVVVTTDAAVPSADAAVVTLTDVVTLSAEAVPTVVSFFDADAAARQDLLNKLRGSTVSASVQVIIDKEWTRSCKVGLECLMALMATGIPVYHSRNMMQYELLTISYEDLMLAIGGSANMTKAAWSRNDEFIFHVEGPVAYQAQARFNSLLEKCVRTTPSDLTLTKGNRYSSEPRERLTEYSGESSSRRGKTI
ncbi:hypothetical protein GQ600_10753 [Phytophthora cactorum]|nr:hypothetical protein GQ600_10753 [Phytophthora cactorum]